MAKSSKKCAPVKSSAQSLEKRSGEKPDSKRGATIDALMKTTGWQQHSVRGFLAGVVRKRLKLDLESKVVDGRRVYRVKGGATRTGGGTQTLSSDEPNQQQA
jgi:hypothetical protein